MPKEDYDTAPMVLTKFTEGFAEIDYSIPLNGPFDVTTPLSAVLLEAQAKHCAVIVQMALVPLDDFYGVKPDESEGETEDDG